jgi:long-chain acyl-CoA synthetase
VPLYAVHPDALTDWAEHHGKSGASYDELVKDPELEKEVADCIEQLNGRLNRWESIKKWIILDHDLTVESGELTPSMKVKRKVVEENYKAEIDKLYA